MLKLIFVLQEENDARATSVSLPRTLAYTETHSTYTCRYKFRQTDTFLFNFYRTCYRRQRS